MDMVDAWSPAEDSDLKNQRRVTAQGSLPFGSAGNLMTHPAIYGSNDPPGVGMFWHSLVEGIPPSSEGKLKRIPKTDFEILRSAE
ncbi:hypothetical protein TNCV_4196501 [Trichonephila clavipes]|nr:hypothetical protein TNCV_4196501 [Trichonephila clavipes]